MNLRTTGPIGKNGKIIEVRHEDYATHPVAGHVVCLEDGYFAFPIYGQMKQCPSQSEAVEYIGRRFEE